MKRLLLFSAVAYGVWTLIRKARERQAAESFEPTGHPGTTPAVRP